MKGEPVLASAPGGTAGLLGNEAIVRGALEAGVAFAAGYPGTPSSEVTDTFSRVATARGIAFEYSVNEKIALEMAFAAALAGARSICAMKHLGLLVAGDPLSTIPYVGVRAGMVIVSAGDPSMHVSPNEHDQRPLGPMLHLPVFDPATPDQACDLTRRAFELSEATGFPVLLRTTTRLAHSRGPVRLGPLRDPAVHGFVRDPERLVPIPENARRLRATLGPRMERAREWVEAAGLIELSGQGRTAIVAGGVPAATTADLLEQHGIADRVRLCSLAVAWPLPEASLLGLLREVDRVLVVEELSPFLEDALAALSARHRLPVELLGKRTGHLPEGFEYEPHVVARGLHALGLVPEPTELPPPPAVPPRPPALCPGCPHRASYFAARAAFGDDHLYFNDIGCYTLGYGAPLQAADALLSMGSGFSLAAGVARVTGKRTVGFMGDSTFFHAGMPALLDAVKEGANIVAVILDNQVTAMTGFQESPGVGVSPAGPARAISIEAVARALGAPHVETFDPLDTAAAIAAFERARDRTDVSVLIAQHACPVFEARAVGPPEPAVFRVDPDRCRACGRAGLRCGQGLDPAFQRAMARSRGLESGCAPEPVAPCARACPLGLCVQGYAAHVAAGNWREAAELIMSRLPLPHTVCRVCHRPCEAVCVRVDIDEHVAINDLKRVVMDRVAREPGLDSLPVLEAEHGRSVAVVGAGPAGLAAAHDLRRRGYRVTLLDALDAPGGLLRTGIPAFRLPPDALDRDLERILGLGVRFRGGVRLGRDFGVADLFAEGFDAVFLAVGAARPRALGVPGEEGSIEALSWLARGAPMEPGRRVVVVGGGNAAMDAARTALRRGAARVWVAYRRGKDEMPAFADEVRAAEEEGAVLVPWTVPVAVVAGGLACVRARPGEVDAGGRARPVVVERSDHLLEAEVVLVAVGQDPAPIPGLAHDAGGSVLVDPRTGATSDPRVFAGGDLARAGGTREAAPRTVTGAIAAGQRAAWGIDLAFRGREAADRILPPPGEGGWAPPVPRRVTRADRSPRARPPELPPAARVAGFVETVGSLDERAARAEAARCMICGMCGNCRACLDLSGCPAFFVEGGRMRIDPRLCNGCGHCADLCPNRAIVPVEPA